MADVKRLAGGSEEGNDGYGKFHLFTRWVVITAAYGLGNSVVIFFNASTHDEPLHLFKQIDFFSLDTHYDTYDVHNIIMVWDLL